MLQRRQSERPVRTFLRPSEVAAERLQQQARLSAAYCFEEAQTFRILSASAPAKGPKGQFPQPGESAGFLYITG